MLMVVVVVVKGQSATELTLLTVHGHGHDGEGCLMAAGAVTTTAVMPVRVVCFSLASSLARLQRPERGRFVGASRVPGP